VGQRHARGNRRFLRRRRDIGPKRKPPDWLILRSIALIDLGIVDDNQFWKLTPKEFRAHIDRLDEVERRKDLRAGIIASAVMNSQGGKEGGVPYTPSDFFATLPQSTDDDGIDIAGWAAFGEFFEKTAKR
jgi:hypothetical protein